MEFILSPFVYLLSFCFLKNRKTWCFGAWFGAKYADNSRYLYEFAANNEERYGITSVWITRNKELAKDIRNKGYKAYSRYSFLGLWYQLRSKVFVCTVNSKDFYFATLTRRNTIIQLWHGAPLKKIGYDAEKSIIHKVWTKIRAFFIDKYSYIISPSKTFDPFFCSAFGVTESKIIRSGYPRNDALFLSDKEIEKIKSKYGADSDKQLLVYLPTHRGEGKNSEIIHNIIHQFIALNQHIADENLIILIKPHFYDIKKEFEDINLSSIKIIQDFGEWDLYQILGASDGLITDYSSVFLDYEITRKPIYFLAPDLGWYVNQGRGMYFEYSSFARIYCESVESLLSGMKETDSHLECSFEINEDKEGGYSRKLFEKLLSVI